MDNAKIHHGPEILELVDRFGVYAKILSLSSLGVRVDPDLNPIEEALSKIKHWIRCHQDYYCAAKGDRILFDMKN